MGSDSKAKLNFMQLIFLFQWNSKKWTGLLWMMRDENSPQSYNHKLKDEPAACWLTPHSTVNAIWYTIIPSNEAYHMKTTRCSSQCNFKANSFKTFVWYYLLLSNSIFPEKAFLEVKLMFPTISSFISNEFLNHYTQRKYAFRLVVPCVKTQIGKFRDIWIMSLCFISHTPVVLLTQTFLKG